MTTVQIVGIAVAVAVGAAARHRLCSSPRRRRTTPAADQARAGGSFLDEAPQDTFAGLGKAEQPVEDITLDPGACERAAEAGQQPRSRAGRARRAAPAAAGRPRPRLGPGPERRATGAGAVRQRPPGATDARPTSRAGRDRDHRRAAAGRRGRDRAASTPPLPPRGRAATRRPPEPARPAEGGPAAGARRPRSPAPASRLVPLSDIIVTTSGKMVDLEDPEVRRMLTELVTFEIDQATPTSAGRARPSTPCCSSPRRRRSRGRSAWTESAKHIRAMMEEIQAASRGRGRERPRAATHERGERPR